MKIRINKSFKHEINKNTQKNANAVIQCKRVCNISFQRKNPLYCSNTRIKGINLKNKTNTMHCLAFRKRGTKDPKEDLLTVDLQQDLIIKDPTEDAITENPKEDPITDDPKENLVTEGPKEDPITEGPNEDPIIEDPKEDPVN